MLNLEDERFQPHRGAIDLVEEAMCLLYKIFPFRLDNGGRVLTVAMADPTNTEALHDIRCLLGLEEVAGVPADPKQIETMIISCYRGKAESIEDIIRSIQIEESDGPTAT